MEHDCTDDCHRGEGCEPYRDDQDEGAGSYHDQAAALGAFLDARRDVCGAVACLLRTPVDIEGFNVITICWQAAAGSADAVVFIKGRVKFGIPRSNGRQKAANHPSSLIGWGTDLRPCAHLGLLVPM